MKMNTADIELRKPLVDVEDQQPVKPVLTPRPRTRRGVPCWCKCVLITMGLCFIMTTVVTMALYSVVSDTVAHLTVTTPHEKYPTVEMTDAQLEAVQKRVELFVDELLAGTAKEPLTVTQDEINGFISHSEYLRGNALVTLNKGSINEEYSLPTDMLPGGKGRYFVAHDFLKLTGKDKVSVGLETAATHHDWFDGPLLFAQLQYLVSDKDMLEMYLLKGSFFGQEAPQDFIDQRQNLLEDLYTDPDVKDVKTVLEGIERVSIEEGKIVVEPKAQ